MIKSAFQYHQQTSYQRDRMAPHPLDWYNQPTVFKDYPGIRPVMLPSDFTPPEKRISVVIKESDMEAEGEQLHLRDLSLILRLTHTLTAKASHTGGDYYFRSAASAGALYPTEIYVVSHGLSGLDDGLYHFAIHRHCLFPLRLGDLSASMTRLSPLTGNKTPILTFIFTAIFFRSAWKYRERSYRYHLLDTGHVVENLILALKALKRPHHISYDFHDEMANTLLGLDEAKEVSLAFVQVFGKGMGVKGLEQKIQKPLETLQRASRVAEKEADYPVIREIHKAGETVSTASGPCGPVLHGLGPAPSAWKGSPAPSIWPEMMNYPATLLNRRSRRNFVNKVLPMGSMAALIEALSIKDIQAIPGQRPYASCLSAGILAGRVEGMEPGFYLLDTERQRLGLVIEGDMMNEMALICLDQAWLSNAACHLLFFTNLNMLDKNWGPRGYRYAMMTAGRLGERLYLVATAMDLGCCGIGAFYDEEASRLLGLNQDSRLLYLVALGSIKSKKNPS